jgi:dTDP-4-dehydrorhamnose reductase
VKILLLGRHGQVGWELQRCLLPLGEVIALDRRAADLADPESLRAVIRAQQPDIIVNAAAYTAVDRAEEEPDLAARINAVAPAVLAEEARQCGALMLHYSTDYVFDGVKTGSYVEADSPAPLNTYGASKFGGEESIAGAGADYLILRTSWVYSARGGNFLLTMLRLMRERETLSVIADQVGAPTWARLIAEVSAQVIARAMLERREQRFTSGIYHLTSSGATSWYGFAQKIAELARERLSSGSLCVSEINPLAAADYPSKTRRPLNSRLDTAALCERFELVLPAWDKALALCLDELLGAERITGESELQ